MENIFANGFLHSPQEMNQFVDSFGSEQVQDPLRHRQHHAVPLPRALDSDPAASGSRTSTSRNTRKKVHEFNLNAFRLLLDGTTNWPAVLEALDKIPLSRLSDVRVLQPLPALPRSDRVSHVGCAGPDAGKKGVGPEPATPPPESARPPSRPPDSQDRARSAGKAYPAPPARAPLRRSAAGFARR